MIDRRQFPPVQMNTNRHLKACSALVRGPNSPVKAARLAILAGGHCLREAGAGGSNPLTPTMTQKGLRHRRGPFCVWEIGDVGPRPNLRVTQMWRRYIRDQSAPLLA